MNRHHATKPIDTPRMTIFLLLLTGAILIGSYAIPHNYVHILGLILYALAFIIMMTIKIVKELSTKKHPEEILPVTLSKYRTTAKATGSSVVLSPLPDDHGEEHVYMSPKGVWECKEFIIISQKDYEELYPKGRKWKTAMNSLVIDINNRIHDCQVGSDFYNCILCVIHYRGKDKENYKHALEELATHLR